MTIAPALLDEIETAIGAEQLAAIEANAKDE